MKGMDSDVTCAFETGVSRWRCAPTTIAAMALKHSPAGSPDTLHWPTVCRSDCDQSSDSYRAHPMWSLRSILTVHSMQIDPIRSISFHLILPLAAGTGMLRPQRLTSALMDRSIHQVHLLTCNIDRISAPESPCPGHSLTEAASSFCCTCRTQRACSGLGCGRPQAELAELDAENLRIALRGNQHAIGTVCSGVLEYHCGPPGLPPGIGLKSGTAGIEEGEG